MKVTIKQEELRFVEELIRKVVDEYIKSLNNKITFIAKLLDMTVMVDSIGLKTIGFAGNTGNGKIECFVKIFVGPAASKEYITFIIAHEFAHILMINPNDVLKLTGVSKDGSTSYTAVKRIKLTGGIYGNAIEEAIADRLAMYIVGKIYGREGVDAVKSTMFENELKRIEFIDQLANAFGVSIDDCDYIDEYVFSKEEGYVLNLFWYKLVTFDFNVIIDEINDALHEYTVDNLDKMLESYFYGKDETAEEYLNVFQKKLNEFLHEEA